MHHSYKQITWLNQVGFFVRSCMGQNVKRKPHIKTQTTYKTSYIGQNKNL